ncbi:MAG: UDP-2,3-diacylglucosamine diphosphatase LpxI [Candidatus Omnitrophica bacterium]|nr:UDP-2,3-diacylglucosamine diphosphatase LpxI [Candidatus Omnitrophota bacterium]
MNNPLPAGARIGLLAGNGNFPRLFARAAKQAGFSIVAFAINEETDPALAAEVESIHWIGVGQLRELLQLLAREGIRTAVMAGQIKHQRLFEPTAMDGELAQLLRQSADHRTDSILGAVAARLAQSGIELIDSSLFLKELMPAAGVMTDCRPSPEQLQDVVFGAKIAAAITALDIGQTVVVKNKTVLSVEAIEGTDEAIRRGSQFGQGGAIVVKLSKPNQDMRFDIPVIGRRTIAALIEHSAALLAIEAEKTLFFDQEMVLAQANKHAICIMAIPRDFDARVFSNGDTPT